jgi:hypothetical protein
MAGHVDAAVTASSIHGPTFTDFDGLIASEDLIEGLVEEPVGFGDAGVYTNPGDLGWHPANTNPSDQLPAFTDGLGGTNNLTGLLNENFINGGNMAESGAPVKVIEYVLGQPTDIGRINILSGNRVNSDGRIFMSTSIMYSTNDGNTFQELGYFQSDPSGVVNNEAAPVAPFDPPQAVTLTSIFDTGATTLLPGVTNLEITFYAVDADDNGLYGDPFDGVNSFTGVDDGIQAAFKSPLIWEIDVLPPAAGVVGDYNGDNVVNLADYTTWRDSLGTTVTEGTAADGSGNGIVDAGDYSVWKLYFGTNTASIKAGTTNPVPEPGAAWLALVACAVGFVTRSLG